MKTWTGGFSENNDGTKKISLEEGHYVKDKILGGRATWRKFIKFSAPSWGFLHLFGGAMAIPTHQHPYPESLILVLLSCFRNLELQKQISLAPELQL